MAQLKNTTIDSTGFLQLPTGTTAQRPSPVAGQIRFNSDSGTAEFYNDSVGDWVASAGAGAASGLTATGGNSVYDVFSQGNTYRVHVFTSTGSSNFVVSAGGEIEYLIVAGGGAGGGGTYTSGGGGAGGLITGTTTVTAQSYTITVGTGGIGTDNTGPNGNNSSAFGLTAVGGGGGGGHPNASTTSINGQNGGSGGGGSQGGSDGGTGTVGQGNNGGGRWYAAGAGGGGAGSFVPTGSNTSPYTFGLEPVSGGAGISLNINGINTFYAGGGGGGIRPAYSVPQGIGGFGGGGNGAGSAGSGVPGTPNTGGGGGGSWSGVENGTTRANGGSGGSGIVIIRYLLSIGNSVNAVSNITNGLVLDLDFAKPTVYNGRGTTVADSRLNGLSGTLVNSPSFVNLRTHRSAFNFNGSNQTINIDPIVDSYPFTVSFWATASNGWNPGSGMDQLMNLNINGQRVSLGIVASPGWPTGPTIMYGGTNHWSFDSSSVFNGNTTDFFNLTYVIHGSNDSNHEIFVNGTSYALTRR